MRVLKDGDWIFGNDLNALVEAFKGNAVESGCAVSDGGSTDMTVAVAAGVVEVAGARIAVAGNNVVLAAASAFKRYDLIVVNNSGVASKVDGTVEKKAPDIPSGYVLLAIVEVPAAATGVSNANIYDCRVMDRAGAAYESADGDYIIDVDTDGNGSGAISLRVNGTDALVITNGRQVGIGGAPGTNVGFYVALGVTASSGIARGMQVVQTLTAVANSNELIALDIASGVFAKGAFTTLAAYGLRVAADSFTQTGAGTISNAYGIYIAAPTIGTNNYSLYVASGKVVFPGATAAATAIHIGGATASTGVHLYSDVVGRLFLRNDNGNQGLVIDAHAASAVPYIGFWQNGANVGNIQITNGAGMDFYKDSTNVGLRLKASEPASGETVAEIRYHNGTSVTRQLVSVGAADTGGTGFKLLRVPN